MAEPKSIKALTNFPTYKTAKVSKLVPYARNSRTHSDEQVQQVAQSIQEFGFLNPIIVDGKHGIIAGHCRVMAAELLGMEEVPTVEAKHLTPVQKQAYIIADNRLAENAGWDNAILKMEFGDLDDQDFDVTLTGFTLGEVKGILSPPNDYADGVAGILTTTYLQPPFSVLDTRKGDWLERKKQWRKLIDDKGESREGALAKNAEGHGLNLINKVNAGVSLFDPVLAEIIVNWFGKPGGKVFDPFSGGIFGYVAGALGMEFTGIDVRAEQVEINQKRCNKAKLKCKYICDTSENMDKHIKDGSVDLVFSCPPYADLEVYSENPDDLSTMGHAQFFEVYRRILTNTYSKLKQNRFAVICMAEVRNKKGAYIGTIPKTIEIMEAAGYTYYNEIILINSAGTLPLRAGRFMQAARKVGKMHQNLLVFVKGNAKTAAKDLGGVEVSAEVPE